MVHVNYRYSLFIDQEICFKFISQRLNSKQWNNMLHYIIIELQFSSVPQLCLTLWDPMDCSMPGSSVLQYLLEFAQIHVHWIGDAIPPSNPLLLLLSSIFPSIQVFASGGWSIVDSRSASVLPMNIQGWFPLGLTGLISLQSKGLLRVFSNTTGRKQQFFSARILESEKAMALHSSTLA